MEKRPQLNKDFVRRDSGLYVPPKADAAEAVSKAQSILQRLLPRRSEAPYIFVNTIGPVHNLDPEERRKRRIKNKSKKVHARRKHGR